MQRSPQQQDSQSNFEMSLRDQLIAAQNNNQTHPPESHAQPGTVSTGYTAPGPSGHTESHIDPDIGAAEDQDYAMGSMNIDDAIAAMADGGRGGARKELSGSKRAAQNRAAQRAFRQRKEAYIQKLEKQVKDYRVMEDDLKGLQHENYQLREYIHSLQSRILKSSGELPAPPPHVNLQDPSQSHQPSSHAQVGADQPPRISTESPAQPTHDPQLEQQPQQQPQQSQQSQQPQHPSPLPEISHFRPIYEPAFQDKAAAPAADMSSRQPSAPDSISAAAVEQLQAAAAGAGEIEKEGAPKSQA